MGRTKETARRKTGEQRRRSSYCSSCGLSMKSFRRTPEARKSFLHTLDTCPPCTRDNAQDDLDQRRSLRDPFWLFVPADRTSSMRKLPLQRNKEAVAVLNVGDVPGLLLYPGARARTRTLYRCWFLEADKDDPKADKKTNNRAERIAMYMKVFELNAAKPIMGDVMFTGPEYTSLHDWEFEKFAEIGEY